MCAGTREVLDFVIKDIDVEELFSRVWSHHFTIAFQSASNAKEIQVRNGYPLLTTKCVRHH